MRQLKRTKKREGQQPLFLFHLDLITEDTIRALVAEKIEDTDYYLLSVEIKSGNAISVELESMGPVSISDCVDISRQIEHNLDREEEDFSLQVSSPGLGKPLKDYRQFVKNVGRHLEIRLANGEEFEGELMSADQEKIEIKESKKEKLEGKKKKELVEINHVLSYPEVKQAKIKILFK